MKVIIVWVSLWWSTMKVIIVWVSLVSNALFFCVLLLLNIWMVLFGNWNDFCRLLLGGSWLLIKSDPFLYYKTWMIGLIVFAFINSYISMRLIFNSRYEGKWAYSFLFLAILPLSASNHLLMLGMYPFAQLILYTIVSSPNDKPAKKRNPLIAVKIAFSGCFVGAIMIMALSCYQGHLLLNNVGSLLGGKLNADSFIALPIFNLGLGHNLTLKTSDDIPFGSAKSFAMHTQISFIFPGSEDLIMLKFDDLELKYDSKLIQAKNSIGSISRTSNNFKFESFVMWPIKISRPGYQPVVLDNLEVYSFNFDSSFAKESPSYIIDELIKETSNMLEKSKN